MAQVAALVLAIFGLLPIANWIPGGHDARWYGERLGEWISGGSIVLGVGLIVAITLNRFPQLWVPGLWARIATRWRAGGRKADAAIACVVLVVCAIVARTVLSAKPLLIDEIIQLFQARIFASGRLWLPAAPFPEFTSAMHLLDWNGKVYGQFPAGGPAMLALGAVAHAEWLVGPVFTAVGAYLFARVLRRIQVRDGTALAALLLYGFAPFTVFLGGSMMNHVTETMWLLAAALALVIATADQTARAAATFSLGLTLGIAATIRPTDAAAFALPSAVWLAWRCRLGRKHFVALIASGVGVAIPMAVLLFINSQQTGHALRFGYIEMWGKSHELGFHAAPWGPAHTPLRGLELVNLYLLRLQDYFLEAAGPSLLFATLALALAPRRRGIEVWILAGSALLLLAYFAYWHDGFYLGPRFMLPLAPWLALWTARLPAMMENRRFAVPIVRATVVAGVVALAIGLVASVPLRARQYRLGMLSMRFDVDQLARDRGVHDALVLVRESWGAQMVTRMWGVGVSRTDAEHIYRSTDACRLELALDSAERVPDGAAVLQRLLAPFHGDSVRLAADRTLPDTTVRFAPGAPRAEVCVRRVAEDRAGFTTYPSLLLARGNGNIYLRDLHARDSLVAGLARSRPVWLLTQSPEIGGDLRFEPMHLDSMYAEWRKD